MQSRIQGLGKRLETEGRAVKLMSREPSVLKEKGIVDFSALLLHFRNYDPDTKGRHLTWLVNRYLENDYLLEDLPRLRDRFTLEQPKISKYEFR